MKKVFVIFPVILSAMALNASENANLNLRSVDNVTASALDLGEHDHRKFIKELLKGVAQELKKIVSNNAHANELANAIVELRTKLDSGMNKEEMRKELNALRDRFDKECREFDSLCMDLIEILFYTKFPSDIAAEFLNLTQVLTGSFIQKDDGMVKNAFDEISGLQKRVENLKSEKDFVPFIQKIGPQYSKIQQQEQNHILSDVDDTLFASSKGGMDKPYPDSQPYPGVHSFHALLSDSYSTLLSARPNLLEMLTRESKSLRAVVPFLNVISSTRSLSDLTTGVEFIANKIIDLGAIDYSQWAINKFLGFAYSYFIYPDKNLLFIGDNGQGDFYTALLIRTFFPQVPTLIHDIKPDGKTPYSNSMDKTLLQEAQRLNIILFDSYTDAAKKLEQLKERMGNAIHVNIPSSFSAKISQAAQ